MRLKTIGHAFDLDSREREARKIIDEWLPTVERPILAFSGGKDSIVLCHMLATHYGVKHAVCATSYWFARTDTDIRSEVVPALGIEVDYRDRLGPLWIWEPENRKYIWPTDVRVFGQFYSLCQQHTVKQYAVRGGYDGVIFGRRKQENAVRLHAYRTADGIENCFPLINWRHEHIWTYIRTHRLPVPSIYNYEIGAKEGCTSWNMIDPRQYTKKPAQLVQEFCPATWERIRGRL